MRGFKEVTISVPTTPNEITEILFACCPEEEPQSAVLQQELIIACSDLVSNLLALSHLRIIQMTLK